MAEEKKIQKLSFPKPGGGYDTYIIAPGSGGAGGSNNAEDIIFNQDLITTVPIGNVVLENGQAVIPAEGQSLLDVWNYIFMKEDTQDLRKTAPFCTISSNEPVQYCMVGTTSKVQEITLGLNTGSYKYGYGYVNSKNEVNPAEGTLAPVSNRIVDNGTGVEPVEYSLTWDGIPVTSGNNKFTCNAICKNERAEVKAIGRVKYQNAGNPISNLGNIYPSQAYGDGNTTAEKTLAFWYYPIYQGFTYEGNTDFGAVISDPAKITQGELTEKLAAPIAGSTKASAVITGQDAYNKIKLTTAIASDNWRQYFLAYPHSYGFTMSEAKDSNGMVFSINQIENKTLQFNKATVDYDIYYIHNASPYKNHTITWTLNVGGK